MDWPLIFLMVVLKIPIIVMMIGLWWVIRQDNTAEPDGGDGGIKKPLAPIQPRRGPHGTVPPPKRIRTSKPALRRNLIGKQ